MTQVELQELAKHFGEISAVNGINLTLEAGSLVALLGPSGCGKTTTLRMIAGLEQPNKGDILFNGTSVLKLPPEQRNIGMVFQRYALFPHMNVANNISFGLRMRGMNQAEIRKRVTEVLDIVQLNGFERRFPKQLSGGQQQRVAIARTVITNPKILLMDEPLANLDSKLREEMRTFISRLQKHLGITTLLVTHDHAEATELADHIAVMFEGRLEQVGTAEDIFKRPNTARVATLMGATNIIKGKLLSKESGESVVETSLQILRVGHVAAQPLGAEVTLTIRPEHITFVNPLGGKNSCSATVLESIYYGGSIGYKVQAGEHVVHIKDPSTRRFSVGEEVSIELAQEHLWIFPTDVPELS